MPFLAEGELGSCHRIDGSKSQSVQELQINGKLVIGEVS